MYEITKNVILSKDFKLEDILNKIDTIWLQSKITDDEKLELIDMARENALAENSYKPVQEQLDNLYKEFNNFKTEVNTRLNTLEGKEDIEEPTEEYPPFVKPEEAHDCYNEGDKITYNGKKYVCKINGCVWNPEAYPAGWEEVQDTVQEQQENEQIASL